MLRKITGLHENHLSSKHAITPPKKDKRFSAANETVSQWSLNVNLGLIVEAVVLRASLKQVVSGIMGLRQTAHFNSVCLFFPLRTFPRELLHHDPSKAQSWTSGLPPVHLQRAGRTAAGSGAGSLAHLSVRGPKSQTRPGRLPTVPRGQPGRRQVSNQPQAPSTYMCLFYSFVCSIYFTNVQFLIILLFIRQCHVAVNVINVNVTLMLSLKITCNTYPIP